MKNFLNKIANKYINKKIGNNKDKIKKFNSKK